MKYSTLWHSEQLSACGLEGDNMENKEGSYHWQMLSESDNTSIPPHCVQVTLTEGDAMLSEGDTRSLPY